MHVGRPATLRNFVPNSDKRATRDARLIRQLKLIMVCFFSISSSCRSTPDSSLIHQILPISSQSALDAYHCPHLPALQLSSPPFPHLHLTSTGFTPFPFNLP